MGGSVRVLAIVTALAALAGPAMGLGWRRLGTGLPRMGQWRQGFDVADLNGDGKPDILHGPPRRGDGIPVVFLGDGRGGFARWNEIRFPELPFDYGDAAAADYNGDARMDVAFGSHLRGLTVLVGDGNGLFERWDQGLELDESGEAFSSRALETGDWDGDGREDLLALGEGPSPGADGAGAGSYGLRVFLNQGDGSWQPREAEDAGRIFGYSLALGDFDGDGRFEAVASARSQGQTGVLHEPRRDGGVARRDLPEARARAVLGTVTGFDLDGDGRDDVVASFVAKDSTGEWIGGIDIYRIDAAGETHRSELLRLPEPIEVSAISAGDLDADGLADVVAGGVGGKVWVFRGRPGGELRRVDGAKIQRSSGGCKVSHLRLADVDGEAGDEIVLAFGGEPGGKDLCPTGGSIQVWSAKSKRSRR